MRGPADPVTAKVEEKDLRQRLAALEAEAAPATGDPLTAYQRRWLERPGTLERFLRADGGKVAKAGRRLRDTLKWREDARPERVCCQACVANEHAHYMHQVGFATTGQPLVYSDIGKAKDKRPESNVEHCIQVLERTIATMDHDHGVETFVWLIDFHGFSSRDLNPRMATSCLKIFSRNYPERMGRIVMVEAPWLFNAMFEFLKTVVDPVTVAKVSTCDSRAGSGGLTKRRSSSSRGPRARAGGASWRRSWTPSPTRR